VDLILEGLQQAIMLLVTVDREVLRVTLLSIYISGSATMLAVVLGLPAGLCLALTNFRGRHTAVTLVNTGMGLPPVVVGLVVSIMLWRYGPFGYLNLMYTPTAMVIAQAIIATPLVIGFTMAGVQQLPPGLVTQILALGASRRQLWWLLLREARMAVLAAVIAGFGGVISEVGASMMVGGNIQGYTRVLTTAIVMEVSKGQFGRAMALSIILMGLAYLVTWLLTSLQQRGWRR